MYRFTSFLTFQDRNVYRLGGLEREFSLREIYRRILYRFRARYVIQRVVTWYVGRVVAVGQYGRVTYNVFFRSYDQYYRLVVRFREDADAFVVEHVGAWVIVERFSFIVRFIRGRVFVLY